MNEELMYYFEERVKHYNEVIVELKMLRDAVVGKYDKQLIEGRIEEITSLKKQIKKCIEVIK